MITPFSKEIDKTQDVLAERTQQEFNAASTGYVPPPATSEKGDTPRNPEQHLERKDVLSTEAARDAGLNSDLLKNFLENSLEAELDLNHDRSFELGR